MDWEKIIFFYPICKDTLSIPRPGVFKDIGVLRGKEQKGSVSKCLRKKNSFRSRGRDKLNFSGGCVRGGGRKHGGGTILFIFFLEAGEEVTHGQMVF